jgi:hypothetical protein
MHRWIAYIKYRFYRSRLIGLSAICLIASTFIANPEPNLFDASYLQSDNFVSPTAENTATVCNARA